MIQKNVYAVVGASGQTGSVVARTLLAGGHAVRVVLRQESTVESWRDLGADIALADVGDVAAITEAFQGCAGAYLLNPPAYQDADLFARAHHAHAAMVAAVRSAKVHRIVALSSVGGQHAQGTGNIQTTYDFEQQLKALDGEFDVAVLRAANFMENWMWFVAPVKAHGVLPSLFQPASMAFPSVSVLDIGRTAASLLTDGVPGRRVVELHGPADSSPVDAAQVLAALLGRPVEVSEPARDTWADSFVANGFSARSSQAFCEMFDGFNSGHIAFEGTHETRRGTVGLSDALAASLPSLASSGNTDKRH
ncbi:NmrA family NAD(P)-binding protein [Variovorax sp. PAMC 28711]|uniref:NmrA family NAD(P)-binding protein n=1 Tax=Variovorax sp. PAMC 28711 TaxID=1795631 RepID=UPI00078E3814|nr:NmrA family NAD(P)-binding protein [Variovorax sp. PAMC 28711]AMM23144.1 hypothetical protein AX767_01225 [Variovorax sp. PAMC 28711]